MYRIFMQVHQLYKNVVTDTTTHLDRLGIVRAYYNNFVKKVTLPL